MSTDRVPKHKQKLMAEPEKQKAEYPEGDYKLKDHLMPVDIDKGAEERQQRKHATTAGKAKSEKKDSESGQDQKDKG